MSIYFVIAIAFLCASLFSAFQLGVLIGYEKGFRQGCIDPRDPETGRFIKRG